MYILIVSTYCTVADYYLPATTPWDKGRLSGGIWQEVRSFRIPPTNTYCTAVGARPTAKYFTSIGGIIFVPFESKNNRAVHHLIMKIIMLLWSTGSAFHLATTSDNSRSSSDLARLQTGTAASAENALALLSEAKALRQQASMLQEQLNREKEERIRKQQEKVDNLIDLLLFHGLESDKSEESKQQLLHTEEQVAQLLISKRMSYDMVNQVFDRIVELANRPQSIDSCSPLLSLLLDAACQVDCLERKDNPNKRWNHRVERDLRKKLFALGYGIRIEDVQKKDAIRSITGEKDYF